MLVVALFDRFQLFSSSCEAVTLEDVFLLVSGVAVIQCICANQAKNAVPGSLSVVDVFVEAI